MGVGRTLVCAGILIVLHAGFSSAQHRTYLRLSELPYEGLPVDITAQCVIGFLMACYGITRVAGGFKDISATSDMNKRSMDSLNNVPSFYHFAHRGRAIH